MNRNRFINWRSKFRFTAGIGVFLAICFFLMEPISEKLMIPGALLCTSLGLVRDDGSGFFTCLLANALLYGVAFAALFLITNRRRQGS